MTTSSATHDAELRMLGLMNLSRFSRAPSRSRWTQASRGRAPAQRGRGAAPLRVSRRPRRNGQSRYVPACGSGWYGENTGKVWGGGVDVLHREFMAEPWEPINHRTNIMDPNFRRAGIGAVQGPDALYITMAFCR